MSCTNISTPAHETANHLNNLRRLLARASFIGLMPGDNEDAPGVYRTCRREGEHPGDSFLTAMGPCRVGA